MNVQAEVGLYPLRTREIDQAIDAFVKVLARAGLTVRKGNMSTALFGDAGAVFDAVSSAFTTVAADGEAVLTLKLSNGCPSVLSAQETEQTF